MIQQQLYGGPMDGALVMIPSHILTFLTEAGHRYVMRSDGRFYSELCQWDDVPPRIGATI
jgi:hypothetical protein